MNFHFLNFFQNFHIFSTIAGIEMSSLRYSKYINTVFFGTLPLPHTRLYRVIPDRYPTLVALKSAPLWVALNNSFCPKFRLISKNVSNFVAYQYLQMF